MRAMLFAPLPLAGCIFGCPDPPPPTEVDANFVYTRFNSAATDFAVECAEICLSNGDVDPADVSPAALKSVESCRYDALDAGAGVAVIGCTHLSYFQCVGGRRPADLVRGTVEAAPVARWLVEAAQLEAASVPAFEILAHELATHDAPAALVERALASADEERRHARIMASLAPCAWRHARPGARSRSPGAPP